MAANTREIKGRIRAVGNIQRITKTMQMIATARFQAMQKRATSAQAYTRKIGEIVGELAGSAGSTDHPLLTPPETPVGNRLVLVITSNRGLCGAYNANILRRATKFINEHGRDQTDIETVGKKAQGFFQFINMPVAHHHTQFGDTPQYEDVERLAQRYMDEFRQGKYDSVHVAYTEFESMSRQNPKVIQLLPLEKPGDDGEQPGGAASGSTDYDFTPDPEQLLADLLPITVKTRLFQCFNEAVVSEQLARMVAMKGATDAAGKMKKNLQRTYNRARQAAITTELSEIIAGAAALE